MFRAGRIKLEDEDYLKAVWFSYCVDSRDWVRAGGFRCQIESKTDRNEEESKLWQYDGDSITQVFCLQSKSHMGSHLSISVQMPSDIVFATIECFPAVCDPCARLHPAYSRENTSLIYLALQPHSSVIFQCEWREFLLSSM